MIKMFDNGWGQNFPLKQFEQNILIEFLKAQAHCDKNIVVINSVWYTQDYHLKVMEQLKGLNFDSLVLVAMLDAAIPKAEWYQDFGRPVYLTGYYPGENHLDFWALFMDNFFIKPDIDQLLDHKLIAKPYMCLNRKPHWHRVRLFDQLCNLDIVDHGIVSMGSNNGTAIKLLAQDCEHDTLAPNATREQTGIPNDIASLGHISNWQQSFLNIVTETVYNINQNHFVSEKIFKPIVGLRPFLVYDTDGAVEWLAARGFEPYVNDFLDISDLDLSLSQNIAQFLKTLCQQPVSYFQSKYVALVPKILYNKNQFVTYVAKQKNILNQGLQCQI
jgi:hypothetical protein